MDYDLIIIGGGIVGLANAMAKSVMKILLVERHPSFMNFIRIKTSKFISYLSISKYAKELSE